MLSVNVEQVVSGLKAVGIQTGDGLLIHSALQSLGRPEGGVKMYLQALEIALGIAQAEPGSATATIAVPAFTFAFAKGEPYDPKVTPSQGMGVFSEYVRCLSEARRTSHPLQSVAILYGQASDLASRDTLSAFDPGSAFERMLELDFKLLLLGASIQAASIVHYSEQRNRVPYRFWKDFTGLVKVYPQGSEKGHWETRTYRMYARDLALDPRLNLSPIQSVLEARRQWFCSPLNYGAISACRLVDFVAATDELLAEDPWALIENRPK